MPMSYEVTTLVPVVTGAGQAVYDALVSSPAGQPERSCLLVPGQIAWDNCDCGQLAQTITIVAQSSTPPAAADDVRQTACGPPYTVARVTLSLVRCVHVIDDNGKPPTCAALLDDAVTLETDRWLARRALVCYLKNLRDTYMIVSFGVGTATSVGPDGGCGGFELGYWIALASVCCG